MQVRVVTMRYQEGLQGFPEDALRAATFGKTVLDVREHFFLHGNVPHLALVLQLGDAPAYGDAGGFRPRGPDAPDPAEGLTDAQKGVYRALRAWRNETARAEGRPAYAVARNAQLAELAKAAPKSLAALREVEGFGEGFCSKYGGRVLALLAEAPEGGGRTTPPAAEPAPGTPAPEPPVPAAEPPAPESPTEEGLLPL